MRLFLYAVLGVIAWLLVGWALPDLSFWRQFALFVGVSLLSVDLDGVGK